MTTRFGPVVRDGHVVSGMRRVLIDFAGGDLEGLQASQPLRPRITARDASISQVSVQRLPENGHWRVAFDVKRTASEPVDLRCYLELYGSALTETWTYQW